MIKNFNALHLAYLLLLFGLCCKLIEDGWCNDHAKNAIRTAIASPGLEGIFYAMAYTESRFNPTAKGAGGEIGLFQIKLSTAKSLDCVKNAGDLLDPVINTRCALAYWNKLKAEFKTPEKIIYAYNFGPENARKHPLNTAVIFSEDCEGKNKYKAKCHLARVLRYYYSNM